MNQQSTTMDGLLERVVERVLERNLDRITKAARPRMMSMPRLAADLDVTTRQARDLVKRWNIPRVQYTPGGTVYVERDAVDIVLDSLRSPGQSEWGVD